MNKKLLLNIFGFAVYIGLVGLFLYFFIAANCPQHPCTHFCSTDTSKYSNNFLFDKFKTSDLAIYSYRYNHENEYDEVEVPFIVRGLPDCGELKYIPYNKNYSDYDRHYSISYSGKVYLDRIRYSYERYCLEKADDVDVGWRLMVCYQDVYKHKTFHVITIIISVLILLLSLLVFSYFAELRDFHGKCMMSLIVAQIFFYILLPFIRSSEMSSRWLNPYFSLSALTFCFMLTLVSLTSMVVKTYLTFKNFKDREVSKQKFSTYATFGIIFAAFSTFLVISSIFNNRKENILMLLLSYIFIGLCDIVVIIITGIKIFIRSRHLSHSDQAYFDDEKKFYWMNFKLFAMMLVTWPCELYIWDSTFNLYGFMTGDVIKLMTALTIFGLLIGRKKVQILLFDKYRGIDADHQTLE